MKKPLHLFDEVKVLGHPVYKDQVFKIVDFDRDANIALLRNTRMGLIFNWPVDLCEKLSD